MVHSSSGVAAAATASKVITRKLQALDPVGHPLHCFHHQVRVSAARHGTTETA
jgi:hypothetical protein